MRLARCLACQLRSLEPHPPLTLSTLPICCTLTEIPRDECCDFLKRVKAVKIFLRSTFLHSLLSGRCAVLHKHVFSSKLFVLYPPKAGFTLNSVPWLKMQRSPFIFNAPPPFLESKICDDRCLDPLGCIILRLPIISSTDLTPMQTQ